MPIFKCSDSGALLYAIFGENEAPFECEESDPSGRFIRYREVLGRGAFKTVYRAFDQVHGIEVAWNQIRLKDVLQTSEDFERLCSEVHLLKTLKHRNIIKFYHSWVDTNKSNINFITEIFTSGTLRQYRKKHRHIDIKAMKSWSRQILHGLLYLHCHDPPIIHRDLKCDNLFINGNQGEVKIGDLGLAAILCHASSAHSVIGTPEFMAPELYDEEYTELVDVYSFGMCLLEMVTCEYPYSECTSAAQIFKKVTMGQKPAAFYMIKDPEVRNFIEKCLATASKRLSARELLMDPFLQSDAHHNCARCLYESDITQAMLDDMDQFGNYSSRSDYQTSIGSDDHLELPEQCEVKQCEEVVTSVLEAHKIGRNVVFSIKGKGRQNDIVYLCLQIMNSEGEIRNIHFPFDLEGDTALCVASEMVTELDLADQDVTKIAEMIDAAILLVVPDWKPGVAIDELDVEGGSTEGELVDGDCLTSKSPSMHPSMLSTNNASVGQSQHSSLVCHRLGKATPTLSSRLKGSIRGGFEELSCVGKHCKGLNDLSVQWGNTADAPEIFFSPCNTFLDDDYQMGLNHPMANGDVCNCQALGKPGLDCETGLNVMKNGTTQDGNTTACLKVSLPWSGICSGFADNEGDGDVDDDLGMQELKELTQQYEQKLAELRYKHEAALLALRSRWQANMAKSHAGRDGTMKFDPGF